MTQDEAVAILKLGVNVFLTGEPGSGKTHTINEYIKWLRERGIDPAVTASTGIAATHVGGMTIHSWSGIGVKKDISEWDIEMILAKEKTAHRIMDARVLIIDEISMLDAQTLDSVDKVLRHLRRRPMQEEQPFGGLQVVFVGDFFQLPPVSRGEAARFAFDAQSWKDANPVVCYLDEQHRQEDPAFLDLLAAVRAGEVEDEHYELLRSRAGLDARRGATRLHTHNAEADRVNEESLQRINSKTHVFQMTSRGSKTLVEALKQNCLSPETLVLKEGALVMFTRNNFEKGYVNGTLGEVTGFSRSGAPLVKTKNGTIEVEAVEWSIQDGSTVLARIAQLPLRLAWAITIHKSQGMSLDAAVIDLSRAFEFGQGYVALSRVRSLEGVYLEGFNDRALMLHPAIIRQDKTFRAKSEAARRRINEIGDTEREQMESNFMKALGGGVAKAKSQAKEKKEEGDGHAELRKKHPNAYRPWTKEEDADLRECFEADMPNKNMAKRFGRQASAVRSRLMHLGLIPNPWKEKNAEKKRSRRQKPAAGE